MVSCGGNNNIRYISSTTDFLEAISRGDSTIYIDDLSFEKETSISLNHNVTINGKDNKSKLDNVNFLLDGTLKLAETTNFTFNNIIFDGMVNESNYDFVTEGQTFYSMFGNNRPDKKCFCSNSGYFNLSLNNCEITRYASYDAPIVYFDNDALYAYSERYLNMDNCYIHHNICYEGGIRIASDKGVVNITNSTFSDNIAKNCASLSVANGKANIDNIKVINNRYYRFVNNNAEGNPLFPTDKLVIGGNEYNYVSFSGAIYFGGPNVTFSNSLISGNKNLFGGGLGFTTPTASTEGQKIEFRNIIIRNNEAIYGGAIYAKCGYGHNVKFVNCSIQNNKAEDGSIMRTTTVIPWMASSKGGEINFIFTTMVKNISNTGDSFVFSELNKPEIAGKINLLGCFVIDNSSYEQSSINYVDNEGNAIKDNVTSLDILSRADKENITPNSGSKADIKIEASVYKNWDKSYSKEKEARRIGFIDLNPPSNLGLILAIVIPCCVVIILIVVIWLIIRHKRRIDIENRDIDEKLSHYTYEELLTIVTNNLSSYSLTNKEFEVATYLLICKSRKEIAEKLFVSEDTAKTHISHIFKKMKISSKQALKEIVNRYL